MGTYGHDKDLGTQQSNSRFYENQKLEVTNDNSDAEYSQPKNENAYQSIHNLHKSSKKCMGFHDIFNRTFENFSSGLDTLLNARLTHPVTNLVTLEKYVRAIVYDQQKASPNYQLTFQHPGIWNHSFLSLTLQVICWYRYYFG